MDSNNRIEMGATWHTLKFDVRHLPPAFQSHPYPDCTVTNRGIHDAVDGPTESLAGSANGRDLLPSSCPGHVDPALASPMDRKEIAQGFVACAVQVLQRWRTGSKGVENSVLLAGIPEREGCCSILPLGPPPREKGGVGGQFGEEHHCVRFDTTIRPLGRVQG
eukprot:scaffold2682_cov344-Pavlova_lutheri.AAC.26